MAEKGEELQYKAEKKVERHGGEKERNYST